MDLWASGFSYDVYNVAMISVKYRFGFRSGRRSAYYPNNGNQKKISKGFLGEKEQLDK
jgi:hypothetical protein